VVALGLLLAGALVAVLAGCGRDSSDTVVPQPRGGGDAARIVNVDLSGWKLTLPEEDDDGGAVEVEPAALTEPWLTASADGGLEFWAPAKGATTENSDHPRTELISLTNFGAGQETHTLRASVTPFQAPQDGQGIILGQIHGAGEYNSVAFVMLRYQDDGVRVIVKTGLKGDARTAYPLLANVPLNTRFDFTLADTGDGQMTFSGTVGGQTQQVRAPIPPAFDGIPVRFQAGNYQQSDDPAGRTDGARVIFHQLVETTDRP
jgi:hypothetical protein